MGDVSVPVTGGLFRGVSAHDVCIVLMFIDVYFLMVGCDIMCVDIMVYDSNNN